MIPKNKPFKLFSCCFPVKGAKRSIVCDVQRQEFEFIPNVLFEILQQFETLTINEVVKKVGLENEPFITEYFDFLYTKEYVFFCDDAEELACFPKMSLEWDVPFHVTNAIIDIDDKTVFNYSTIAQQLDELLCPHIQLRYFKRTKWTETVDVFQDFLDTTIKTIDVILPYHSDIERDELRMTCIENKRLTLIQFYNAPINKTDQIGYTRVNYTTEKITNASHCGVVRSYYFTANINLFAEAQHHNTCLNRKISIDSQGNIKNCPSMPQAFGNIENTSLQKALSHPDFKKYWNIKKDQIFVCRDCEFRYICTDCRAFIENPKNIYSKPLKCNYNPYTCEWTE